MSDNIDLTGPAVTTGVTTITLFGLLVALTKWIGGNYAKEVTELKNEMKTHRTEHKQELDAIKDAHEDCLKQHTETALALATLRGRMSAIERTDSESKKYEN